MRLPWRAGGIARWFAQTPGRTTRLLIWLCVASTLWGSRLPGWTTFTLQLGIVCWCAITIAMTIAGSWRMLLLRWSAIPPLAGVQRRVLRRCWTGLLCVPLILVFRPSMYVCFWLSRPAFDATVQEIVSEPFSQSAANGIQTCRPLLRAGLYEVSAQCGRLGYRVRLHGPSVRRIPLLARAAFCFHAHIRRVLEVSRRSPHGRRLVH